MYFIIAALLVLLLLARAGKKCPLPELIASAPLARGADPQRA